MSNVLNSEDYGLKIYNRFPPKYREDDVSQHNALKRYLQALNEGGFKYIIENTNKIMDLIDPNAVEASLLGIMFQQYGLSIFNGIPEEYLRYLLPRLGEAWSKKGSLEAIEFITTSVSGVKTTIDIDYDSSGNPLVTVNFEMDYALGDYFPNNDQFKKLLVNFIPFYCDTNMVYYYLFYEKQILIVKDEELLNIHQNIEESSIFKTRDLNNSENTALLGKAVFGKAILNYTGIDSDEWEDNIKEISMDTGILAYSIDSNTNTNYNVLNDNPNNFSGYDVIKTKNSKNVVYRYY